PLFVAPLTYLAIAGDRSRGTITYLLGLPNTRSEYFVAKYVSRATVAVAAVVLGTALGFVVAATTFTNGADPARFLTFGAVSGLYALAITGLFLAISATTAERSRAMFGVIAAYFLFVPFWFGFLPFVSLATVLDAVSSVPGLSLSKAIRDVIGALSPTTAYFQSTEFVYAGVMDQYPEFSQFDSGASPLAHNPVFTTLVLVGWAIVAPLVGYLRFRTAELG
ncbi:MAG: ABC transporter permease subunit, partial [Haloarculaceae archaeon]